MKKTFVVLVNFNGLKNTLDCLQSLKKCPVSVVVVDNGSRDNSAKLIKKQFPQIKLIVNKTNRGFAAACNQGIDYGLSQKADYLLLLNNDTLVKPDFVNHLLARAESKPEIGLVGAKIYFAPGFEFHKQRYKKSEQGKVIWYAGGEIDWQNVIGRHWGVDQVDSGQFQQVKSVDFISGCCLLIKTSVLEKIGSLEEKYFLYLEDMDFCVRAKRAGYQFYYEPKAVIWHKNAASSHCGSALQDYYFSRNRLLFAARYAPLKTYLAVLRQAMGLLLSGRRWQKKGVVDFFLKRFDQGSFKS
ncbi:glycosyltransferase family 2 protein [Patescibacteria group bacterium]|nr:glycosyltransferase family 2 protein [Patescibacteria group bacterium]MBU1931223.1 glycosyltransferase family 2 protein [Patescibacteria group bacterium]